MGSTNMVIMETENLSILTNTSLATQNYDPLINLDFQQDGFDNDMSCAQSSSSYTLMCRNKYDELVAEPASSNSIETSGVSEQITWMAILICIIAIVLLILNTMRLTRKVKEYEIKAMNYKDENDNEDQLEI